MLQLDPADRHADVVTLPDGQAMTIRFAGIGDAAALQAYFRSLSPMSRYNRLMGAASELPAGQLHHFTHPGLDDGFTVIALVAHGGSEFIVGEARYAIDGAGRFEVGLSVHDAMKRRGIGTALLADLQCRAAAHGAPTLFGDTLRSNAAMLGLARRLGARFAPTPGDWKQMRFEKAIDIARIPCASWRLAAPAAMAAS